MSRQRPAVVDTNVLFSALLAPDTHFARILLTDPAHDFYIGETVVVEMFEHRDRLLKISKLDLADLLVAFHLLLRKLTLFKENAISEENLEQAVSLCQGVDPEDALHVALALELDAQLWTGDKQLREHLRKQGFDRIYAIESP